MLKASGIFLLVSVLGISFLSAGLDGEKIVLPEEEQSGAVQVQVDSSNLRIEPFSGEESFTEVMQDSFASAFPRPEKKIRWVPARDPENPARTRLKETVVSYDLSAILLTEETGTKNGPKGTRILIMDSQNLRILKVLLLPFRAEQISPAGNTGKIWCLHHSQEELEDKNAICIVNAVTGSLEQEIPYSKLPLALSSDLSGKFAWILSDGGIRKLFPDGVEKTFLEVPGAEQMRLSPDCRFLAYATQKETILHDILQGKECSRVPIVPDGVFQFLQGEPFVMLIGSRNRETDMEWPKKLFLAPGGSDLLPVSEDLAGNAVPDFSGKSFYDLKARDRVERRANRSGTLSGECNLRSLKPTTSGVAVKLFPTRIPDTFLVLDSRGGFYRVNTSRKRWKKEFILRAWNE